MAGAGAGRLPLLQKDYEDVDKWTGISIATIKRDMETISGTHATETLAAAAHNNSVCGLLYNEGDRARAARAAVI